MNDKIGAVVLAAGRGARVAELGHLKPLLPFGDKPMLARVLDTLYAAGVVTPVVVTGHAAERVRGAVPEYSLHFAHNENWQTGGMLSSVQAGVRALPRETTAFFLSLGDQPLLKTETLESLLTAWRETRAPLVLPNYHGKHGHPVLFDARCRDEILALPADATLRACIHNHAHDRIEIEVDDEGVRLDVDTPEDYERALTIFRAVGTGAGAELTPPRNIL